jgi:transcriptional regulator with XRE-family HTH domain
MIYIMENQKNKMNFFKAVRIASGLPLQKLALKSELVPQHYRQLERSGTRADLSTIVRVKRASKLDWATVGQFLEDFVGEE